MTYSTQLLAAVRHTRIGYCQKHASARFTPVVHTDRHQFRRFCTSGPVDYERITTHASGGSINRYYDPGTGQFLSVDPLVAETGDAYAYAGGDPVNLKDPRGLATIGVCGGGNVQLGFINVGAEDCLTRTVDQSGEDDIGLVAAPQGGLGVGADVSVGGYYQISNATNLQELSGPFEYATVGGQLIGGTTVTVFWNGSRTNPIYGIDLGVSVGLGADVAIGLNDTWVLQFNNWIEADIARGAWDSAVPGAIIDSIVKDLTRARTAIKTAQKCP